MIRTILNVWLFNIIALFDTFLLNNSDYVNIALVVGGLVISAFAFGVIFYKNYDKNEGIGFIANFFIWINKSIILRNIILIGCGIYLGFYLV